MTNQTTQPTGMLTDEQLQKIIDVCASKNAPIMGIAIRINSIVSQAYEARIAELEAQVAGYKLHMQRQGKSIAAHVFAALQSPTKIPKHIHLHAGEEDTVSFHWGDKFSESTQQPPTTEPVNMSAARELPPLPPLPEYRAIYDVTGRGFEEPCYNADQMRAYAQAAIVNSMLAASSEIDGGMRSAVPVQTNEEALRKALDDLKQAQQVAVDALVEERVQRELIGREINNVPLSQPANEVKEYWCGTCERNVDVGCGDSACQFRYKLPANEVKVDEQHPDATAVDRFAVAMKMKLAMARSKGRSGWDDPAQCTLDRLSTLLRKHVEKGDPVDVANFCMMLQQRGSGIQPSDKQAVQAVPSWQPIETAPKDGTRLFLYWASQNSDGSFMRHERVIGRFMQDGLWHIEDAMFANVVRHEKLPEYWMPLPAAPQPDQKG